MRSGIIRRRFFQISIAVTVVMLSTVSPVKAYYDDVMVDSDYYQLSPKDQNYDRKVLEEKRSIAQSQGSILAQIAKLDDEIHEIDKDLMKYTSTDARNVLLLQRKRLFRKRREYKAVVASYTERQIRMTQDLSYNSQSSRAERGDAYENGDFEWTTGEQQGGLSNPNWDQKNTNQGQKTVFKVKNEKNIREVAEKISNSIYGEFNNDIYVELLSQNMGNVAINPRNLIAGDQIFIPYKIALLTMMGIKQKSLVDSTLDVVKDVSDSELKRDLIRYAVIADENKTAKASFVQVLVALKMHGENSKEFKNALTKFHEASDESRSEQVRNLTVSTSDRTGVEFRGKFRDKVAAVSNASLQLNELPDDTRNKVKKAAEEYNRLKLYVKDYGSTDSRTKKQADVFRAAIESAYPAVQRFSERNPSTFLREDRYTVENDDSEGTRSRSLASVDLAREIRAMNSQILTLIKKVSSEVDEGWDAHDRDNKGFSGVYHSIWEPRKKEATRNLKKITSLQVEGSAASQLFNRLKVVYATAHKNSVNLYDSVNFSLLRKRMIGLIGMNIVVEMIQPSYMSGDDGTFRNLSRSEALTRLGIDIDKMDFYDVGEGSKPQFRKLNSRHSEMLSQAEGLRGNWESYIALLATMSADFRDQDRFAESVKEAREFWTRIDDKLSKKWKFRTIGSATGLGLGVGTLVTLAATNFWNPVGWVAVAAAGGAAGVGYVIGEKSDESSHMEMIREYGQLRTITDLALASVKENDVKPIESMLYLDEIVHGYL